VGARDNRFPSAWTPRGQLWTEAQLLESLALLEESRASHLAYRRVWAERRSAEKQTGRRQPAKEDLSALHELGWFMDLEKVTEGGS
jgi:hypothetical protein